MPHPTSSPALAPGKPVHSSRGESARPAAPFLTAKPATGPPLSPSPTGHIHSSAEGLSNSRDTMGQRKFLAASMYSMRGSLHRQQAPQLAPSIRNPTGRSRLHSCTDPLQAPHHSVRWIRAWMFPFSTQSQAVAIVTEDTTKHQPSWSAGGSSTTYWVGAGHCANDGAYIEPIKNCANKPGTTAESSRGSHPAGLIASSLGDGGRCVAYSKRLRLRRRS